MMNETLVSVLMVGYLLGILPIVYGGWRVLRTWKDDPKRSRRNWSFFTMGTWVFLLSGLYILIIVADAPDAFSWRALFVCVCIGVAFGIPDYFRYLRMK